MRDQDWLDYPVSLRPGTEGVFRDQLIRRTTWCRGNRFRMSRPAQIEIEAGDLGIHLRVEPPPPARIYRGPKAWPALCQTRSRVECRADVRCVTDRKEFINEP
jgi:hypothetical protein